MIVKNLGLIEYQKFLQIQDKLTALDENFLIFATHYPIFTIGTKDKELFPFALKVKRGGSITYFDEGILMAYFIFNIKSPYIFFKKVRKVFNSFFSQFPNIYYNKKNPGYYIENRKVASIGFHYTNNRSNHGVAININPNLEKFNTINPCNLSNIKATSLYNEGYKISKEKIIKQIINFVKEEFNES